MKVKKHIGEVVNGFLILDTYSVVLPSGKKTRKVLLKCEDCGREFERQAGVDFAHIKCKCKVKNLQPRKCHYRYIEWEGKTYTLTALCELHDINIGTFRSRLERGYSVEEAVKHEFDKVCPICGKTFATKKLSEKYCCKTCKLRGTHKGPYHKELNVECVVCGKEFKTLRPDSKTCSKICRTRLARIERGARYKHLRAEGRFDPSVTLARVYEKFDGECQKCGKLLTFDLDWQDKDYPTIDHIIPLAKGGAHEWDNVQLLCLCCNSSKGAR